MGRATDFSNCYIYHIKSMDGVIHYVGSTSNMNSRKSCHRYNCSHENHKFYNIDIYKYIRNNGGFDNFEIVPIRKLENISNKNDLLIAERLEMEKYSDLKNMRGSYQTKEERIEYLNKWKRDHPECQRKYREANRAKVNEYQRKYRQQKKQLNATDQ